jgi:hypothetical protein
MGASEKVNVQRLTCPRTFSSCWARAARASRLAAELSAGASTSVDYRRPYGASTLDVNLFFTSSWHSTRFGHKFVEQQVPPPSERVRLRVRTYIVVIAAEVSYTPADRFRFSLTEVRWQLEGLGRYFATTGSHMLAQGIETTVLECNFVCMVIYVFIHIKCFKSI